MTSLARNCHRGERIRLIIHMVLVCVCFLCLFFNVLVNNFQSFWDRANASWVFTNTL